MPDIWFINLAGARERRALIEVQAEALGLDVHRQEACTVADIDDATYRRLSTSWERPMTRPELAAFLSHRRLWERAADSEDGLIVLEDDTVFGTHVPQAAANAAASGFDLVNFETVGRRKFFRRGGGRTVGGVRFTELVREKSGAGAYFVSQNGARALLAKAETQAAPVDAFMFGVCHLAMAQVEPAATMQVHLLEERGFDVGLSTQTSIHQPRQRLPLSWANLPYTGRRIGTQLRLALVQARRLADVEFRPAGFDAAAFTAVLPVSRDAMAARLGRYDDQSVS